MRRHQALSETNADCYLKYGPDRGLPGPPKHPNIKDAYTLQFWTWGIILGTYGGPGAQKTAQVSEDSCVRIKINSQTLYGGERNLALTPNAYFNNIVIKARLQPAPKERRGEQGMDQEFLIVIIKDPCLQGWKTFV